MPTFDDRFARQNRCEPPPEFPLASPYAGIVHLLSGPAPHAPTQIRPTSFGIGRRCAPPRGFPPAFTFITRRGLTPEHSHAKTTPWSVFQDGSLAAITPASLRVTRAILGPPRGVARRAITPPPRGGGHVPAAFVPRGEPMLARRPGGSPRPRGPGVPPGPVLAASASLSTISRTV